jgi:hypothetical protein
MDQGSPKLFIGSRYRIETIPLDSSVMLSSCVSSSRIRIAALPSFHYHPPLWPTSIRLIRLKWHPWISWVWSSLWLGWNKVQVIILSHIAGVIQEERFPSLAGISIFVSLRFSKALRQVKKYCEDDKILADQLCLYLDRHQMKYLGNLRLAPRFFRGLRFCSYSDQYTNPAPPPPPPPPAPCFTSTFASPCLFLISTCVLKCGEFTFTGFTLIKVIII